MKCLKFALLALMCVLTAACAAKQEMDPATVTASYEWRLKSLEESFLNFREEQRDQADKADEVAAATDKRLTAVEVEIAALKAAAMADSDAPDDMMGAADSTVGEELKAEPGASGWTDGRKTDQDGMAQSGEEKPWAIVPGPPSAEPEPAPKPEMKAPEKPISKPAAKPADQTAYDAALALYNSDQFEKSRTAFDAFLGKYPKSDLVPNALYWKGETFYSQKDYAQSILTFKEVTGRYPKHSKAAAALLKIGMAYDNVGDRDNAVFYLRALVEDFPKSDPAKLARQELKRLGG